jgi:hypothetical protein
MAGGTMGEDWIYTIPAIGDAFAGFSSQHSSSVAKFINL